MSITITMQLLVSIEMKSMYLYTNAVVSLFVRIHTCDDNAERKRQLNDFMFVLELLLVPTDWFCFQLERLFFKIILVKQDRSISALLSSSSVYILRGY